MKIILLTICFLMAILPVLLNAESKKTTSSQQDEIAYLIRWAILEAEHGIGAQRYQALDKAILKGEKLLIVLKQAGQTNSHTALAIEYDLLVALHSRSRMPEVIQRFLAFKKRGLKPPAYVLAAVAAAYLELRHPKVSVSLYQQALALEAQSTHFPTPAWQFGLVQAYLDNYQFDAAQRLLKQLKTEIPPLLHQGIRQAEINNETYEEILANAARIKLYADQLDKSQAILEKGLKLAPFNLDSRLAMGELQQRRQQPRKAQQHFTKILVDHPSSIDAALGITQTALQLGDYATARYYLTDLTHAYPENSAVQRTQKEFISRTHPRLSLSLGHERSSLGASTQGENGFQIESRLSSAVMNDHYQLFLRTLSAQSEFNDLTATRKRLGIGVRYKTSAQQLSVELNEDPQQRNQLGFNVGSRWFLDDHWRIATTYESNSDKIPLQADAAGIKATSFGLGVNFSRDESQQIAMNISQLRFSDDNVRTEANISWSERWISEPEYKLGTQLRLSGSNNSHDQRDYFNPSHDLSLQLSVINEGNLWRSPEQQLIHRLTLGTGIYQQQGFDDKTIVTAKYEHQWEFEPQRSLSYGIEYQQHPYDGITDKRTAFFLELDWWF